MVWTCRCRNDLILTWNKKLRKYTNGGKWDGHQENHAP